MNAPADSTAPSRHSSARYVGAGLAASLVGIGMARFAYTPLVPPLIEAHWFAAADVVFLSGANLAGYVFGALAGRPLAAKLGSAWTLRWMMVLVAAAFLGCAFPLSVPWFFAWRLLSGMAGGVIMVLVASTVLPHVPAGRRGLASGAIFLGAGLGIAGSGTLVPLLLGSGLRETWLGLGAISALLTAACWSSWPQSRPAHLHDNPRPPDHLRGDTTAVRVFYLQYALVAVTLVPAMLFLADFVARGHGAGADAGARVWAVYGLGAIVGPVIYGWIADRFGGRGGLAAAMATQALAMLALAAVRPFWAVTALAFVIGTFPAGVPSLALARLREAIPHDHLGQNQAWSRATVVFAIAQALVAYLCSAVFNGSGGRYLPVFLIGSAGAFAGIAAELAFVAGRRARGRNVAPEWRRARGRNVAPGVEACPDVPGGDTTVRCNTGAVR